MTKLAELKHKALGKIKEVVAEIAGDAQLAEEGKVDVRNGEAKKDPSLKPLGNLDKLT